MRLRQMCFAALVLLVLPLVIGTAAAQEDVIASGLNNPRKLAYGSDGTLYIAETGTGGETEGPGPYGLAHFGLTGQVSAVTPDGEKTVILGELVSLDTGFGTINGADSLMVNDASYWIALGTGPRTPPSGKAVESVIEVDRTTLAVKTTIDLRAYEEANNPDGGPETVSNPIDLALADDGTLYIADASANTLLTWTAADGLKTFAVWPPDQTGAIPQAVPTALDIGPDGDIYVGFLSGFPHPPQGARIERYSPTGELKETYANLTLVTDILVTDDGSIYAVEMASGFGDLGFISNSGRVVEVTDEGLSPIMSNLNFPFGLAQNADGNLIVTVNSAFSAPDSGMVIPVVEGVVLPAATPEVATTPEVAVTPEVATTPEADSGG